MLTTPHQILDGRYRVLSRIGKGAMGSVYRAEHVKLGRVVAVKVINEHVPNDLSSRRRFEREARAMARLEHPHCASVLDIGVHEDQPFVVMDFISGEDLAEVVAKGPLSIERAVEITRQILFGLEHAHERGIIHRDIKPSNIALSQKVGVGDHAKILDFGLAKINQETSNLTSGLVVGTPSYMAPEQIRGLLVDRRVDLYACGVLLFELLTGKKPFRSSTSEPLEICMKHLNDPPPRLSDVCPGRDFGALEDVVAVALAKDREERFATAGAFANALAAATGAPVTPSVELAPIVPARRTSKRWLAIAVGAVALAAVALLAIVATDGPSTATAAPVPAPAPVIATAPVEPPAPVVDQRIDEARGPYEAGLRYMQKMWWDEGIKQLKKAIALDPSLRSDPKIISNAIRGFNIERGYNWRLASFLHDDIGAAAKPFLEDVAKHHPYQRARSRATAELRRY